MRGFAPGGIGPRDITNSTTQANNGNALGGTKFYGGSLEAQSPIWGLPRDIGLKGAIFADAGSLWDYRGSTNFGTYLGYTAGTGHVLHLYEQPLRRRARAKTDLALNGVSDPAEPVHHVSAATIHGLRSSVGVGLIWASPMGPIRFNYSFVLSKNQYRRHAGSSASRGGTNSDPADMRVARARPQAAPFSYPDFSHSDWDISS